jgi:hypothetical protein
VRSRPSASLPYESFLSQTRLKWYQVIYPAISPVELLSGMASFLPELIAGIRLAHDIYDKCLRGENRAGKVSRTDTGLHSGPC